MTITTKQAAVLNAFLHTAGSGASAKEDIGMTWTDMNDIMTATGFSEATAKGVLGTLVRDQLVHNGDDDGAVDMNGKKITGNHCLTDAGCDAVDAANAEAAAKEAKKNRVVQNGVKHPLAGSLCGAAWELCDKLTAELGRTVTVGEAKTAGVALGLHPGNVGAEHVMWRKFHGYATPGRAPKADEAPAVEDAEATTAEVLADQAIAEAETHEEIAVADALADEAVAKRAKRRGKRTAA